MTDQNRSYSSDLVYNKIRIGLDVLKTHGYYLLHDAEYIDLINDDVQLTRVTQIRHSNEIGWGRAGSELTEIANYVAENNVAIEYKTQGGVIAKEDVPAWLQPWIDVRDPLKRIEIPGPDLTLEEVRLETVTNWAVQSTNPRTVMASLLSGKRAILPDSVLSKKRDIGGIWCAFVAATLAAAQNETWIANANVWAGIERNMEIDPFDFFNNAPPDIWNEVAGHLETFSRFYKAPATQLTSKPIHVAVGTAVQDSTVLQANAEKVRNIIYKGVDE